MQDNWNETQAVVWKPVVCTRNDDSVIWLNHITGVFNVVHWEGTSVKKRRKWDPSSFSFYGDLHIVQMCLACEKAKERNVGGKIPEFNIRRWRQMALWGSYLGPSLFCSSENLQIITYRCITQNRPGDRNRNEMWKSKVKRGWKLERGFCFSSVYELATPEG